MEPATSHYMVEVIAGRSLCFYASFLMFGLAAKCCILRCIHPCFQPLSFDMTAAFVVYGCSFCHGYIANTYGPASHVIALLVVGLLQRIVLCGCANPLPYVIKLVDNPCNKDAALWRVGAVMVGGVIAHPFAKLLWVGLMPELEPHDLEHMHCVMPSLTGRLPIFVPLTAGVELLGSLIVCAMFSGSTFCATFDAYELCTKFVLGCFFVCLDRGYTAIHLNPAIAGSMLFGCVCDDAIKALGVYWLAPILAAIAFGSGLACSLPSPSFGVTCCPTTACPRPCQSSAAPCSPASSCPLPCRKVVKQCAPPQPSCSLPCPKPAAALVPTSPNDACCPPTSCPRPCDPKGQITAQMRQVNKDGQKQVNYVICIPPMCTEKGVRLQHKFIVNKDDNVEGDEAAEGANDKEVKERPKNNNENRKTHVSPPRTRSHATSSRFTRSEIGKSMSSNNNSNFVNVNASNRQVVIPASTSSELKWPSSSDSVVASYSGPLDIKLDDNRTGQHSGQWVTLSPTVKRRTATSRRPVIAFQSSSDDVSD